MNTTKEVKEHKESRITVVMTESQLKRIKKFMINEEIFSRSAAAMMLIEAGLEVLEARESA